MDMFTPENNDTPAADAFGAWLNGCFQ